jgi:hypothetical protein
MHGATEKRKNKNKKEILLEQIIHVFRLPVMGSVQKEVGELNRHAQHFRYLR